MKDSEIAEQRKAAYHDERQLRLFSEIGTYECVNDLVYQGEIIYLPTSSTDQ